MWGGTIFLQFMFAPSLVPLSGTLQSEIKKYLYRPQHVLFQNDKTLSS